MDKSYNGWSNWETWNVNLWLTNDEVLYEMAREAKTADGIRELILQLQENAGLTSGLFADLINTGLQAVNWQEIYEGLHED